MQQHENLKIDEEFRNHYNHTRSRMDRTSNSIEKAETMDALPSHKREKVYAYQTIMNA